MNGRTYGQQGPWLGIVWMALVCALGFGCASVLDARKTVISAFLPKPDFVCLECGAWLLARPVSEGSALRSFYVPGFTNSVCAHRWKRRPSVSDVSDASAGKGVTVVNDSEKPVIIMLDRIWDPDRITLQSDHTLWDRDLPAGYVGCGDRLFLSDKLLDECRDGAMEIYIAENYPAGYLGISDLGGEEWPDSIWKQVWKGAKVVYVPESAWLPGGRILIGEESIILIKEIRAKVSPRNEWHLKGIPWGVPKHLRATPDLEPLRDVGTESQLTNDADGDVLKAPIKSVEDRE